MTDIVIISALAIGTFLGCMAIMLIGWRMTRRRRPRRVVWDEPMEWQEPRARTRIAADFVEKE